MAGTQPAVIKCNVCDVTSGLKRCSKCQYVFYCSREHQLQDWSQHKKQCKLKAKGQLAKTVDSATSVSSSNDSRKANSVVSASAAYSSQTPRQTDTVDSTTSRSPVHNATKGGAELAGFDPRPIKLYVPEKKEVSMKTVVEFVFNQLTSKGFCVLDNFHDNQLCLSALKEVEQIESAGIMADGQLSGGKTSGQSSQMRVEKTIRSDKITWLQGFEKNYPSICGIVSTHDAIVGGLNAFLGDKYTFEGRTKAMVACYPGNGTFYGRHIDNPNKDGRCITCLFYLNKDWDPLKDGGVLRLFLKDGDYVDIAPLLNRVLFFWSDRRSPHEVRPAFRHRYAITTWYFDKVERDNAKKEETVKETNNIQKEISRLEVKTKQVEMDVIEKKIEQASQSAVDLLSPDELQALSTMVRSHPDPKALLTGLGLAPSIQHSLLTSIGHMEKH